MRENDEDAPRHDELGHDEEITGATEGGGIAALTRLTVLPSSAEPAALDLDASAI